MNRTKLFLTLIIVSLLLISCDNLNSNAIVPPLEPSLESSPDQRLTGAWIGEPQTTVTTETHTYPLDGGEYTLTTTITTIKKYTFYSNSKIDLVESWSKDVKENGALTSSLSGSSTVYYEWKKSDNLYSFRDYKSNNKWAPFDIDLTNINTGEIKIDDRRHTKK